MVFGHVDAGGAHVILEHRHTALLLHYPACGRPRNEREGGAVLVVVAALLAISAALLYGDLLLATQDSEQSAEQQRAQSHWMRRDSAEKLALKKNVLEHAGLSDVGLFCRTCE